MTICIYLLGTANFVAQSQSYFNSIAMNSSSIGKYEKIEIDFDVSTSYTNPYDKDEIRIYCEFKDAGNNYYSQDAFYYEGAYATFPNGPYSDNPEIIQLNGTKNWKVRFTPNRTGRWSFRLCAVDDAGTHYSSYYVFNCTSNNNKGFIKVKDTRYLKYDDNSVFIPIGGSYPWYDRGSRGTEEIKDAIDTMQSNGINFFRFEIFFMGSLSIMGWDFQHQKNYYSFFNQRDSWRLDEIIEYARQKEIKLVLALFAHSSFGDSGYCENRWSENNPFNTNINPSNSPVSPDMKGDCNTPYEFYSKPSAIDIQKRYIRYVISRWGYATNILAFELMDEADRFDVFNPNFPPPPSSYNQDIINWHIDKKNYINSIDPFDHLVTTAFCSSSHASTALYKNMDFTQIHHYTDYDKWNSSDSFQEALFVDIEDYYVRFSKPVMHGEFGWSDDKFVEDPKLYDLHSCLWSGLFNGALSPPSIWTLKDPVEPKNQFGQFKGVSKFSKLLTDLDDKYKPKKEQKNGFRLYYMKNETSNTIYGWIQDFNFRFRNLYNNYPGYLNNWISNRPPYLSEDYFYWVNIDVPVTCRYELKWYDTTTGNFETKQTIYAVNNQVEFYHLSSLRSGVWADGAFILSCKPSSGWVERQTSPGQWNNVRSDSELELNTDANNLFYINSNGKVCLLYKDGQVWVDAIIDPSAITAISGRGLAFNPLDNGVYYVGTDNKIYRHYYSSGNWHHEKACSGQWNNARSDSELETNPNGNNIFYINSDNKVCLLNQSSGYWYDNVINGSAITAISGRGLVYNAFDESVLYVGSDYKIYRLYYSSGWHYEKVCSDQWNNVRSDSELEVSVNGTNIYYINSNGQLCLLYRNGSSWSDAIINGSAANVKAGTNFTIDRNTDQIYYIGEDNCIYNMYYSGGWTYKKLNQTDYCQAEALSGICSLDDRIYYTGTDYKIHDFVFNSGSNDIIDEISETNKSKFTENDAMLFPNPVKVNGTLYCKLPNDFENSRVRIYNVSGALIKEFNTTNNTIEVNGLEKGMYLISITISKITITEKILVVE